MISFFFSILSTCCITVLDIPGFINRTALWQGGKQSHPMRTGLIAFFREHFVFLSRAFFSLFFNLTQLFEIFTAVMAVFYRFPCTRFPSFPQIFH